VFAPRSKRPDTNPSLVPGRQEVPARTHFLGALAGVTRTVGSVKDFICTGNQRNCGALLPGLRQPHSTVFRGEPPHCRARRGSDLERPARCTLEFDLARRDLGLQRHSGADRADARKVPPFERQDAHGARLPVCARAAAGRPQAQPKPLRK
jgi:hypothetical protein